MRELLRNAMKDIQACDERLFEALLMLPSVYTEYYSLPRVKREHEHLEINHYPDVIPIESVHSGVESDVGAMTAMLNLYGEIDYSTRIATRNPGLMCKRASDKQYENICRLAQDINEARARFVAIAHTERDKNVRYDVVHELFPMLIMRNVQREIECVRSPSKFYMSWANKPIVTKVDLNLLVSKLENDMHKEPPVSVSRKDWVDQVKYELSVISRIPKNRKLRIRRPVKSETIATIDGRFKVCPIPKIVLMQNDNPPAIKPLKPFNKYLSKPRGKRVDWRPVIDRYNLYMAI